MRVEVPIGPLHFWQEENGLDDEQTAALLSNRLGRTISVTGYRNFKRRTRPPLDWLEALDVAPREPVTDNTDNEPEPELRPRKDKPELATVSGLDIASARMQLVLM